MIVIMLELTVLILLKGFCENLPATRKTPDYHKLPQLCSRRTYEYIRALIGSWKELRSQSSLLFYIAVIAYRTSPIIKLQLQLHMQ